MKRQIAAEKGAKLTYLPLTADARLDLDQLDDVLTDKTRLVAVTGMSNMLGTINPIERITAKAKQHGALVMVDAAQSVPHLPVNVVNSQIDFLAFSGHKLYGPTGIGVLYGRRELLESMPPFLGGGHMIDRVYRDHSTWADPPARFEAGTLPIVEAIALGTAIDYVTGTFADNAGLLNLAETETFIVADATAAVVDPMPVDSVDRELLNDTRSYIDVAAANHYTCGVRPGGGFVCWGDRCVDTDAFVVPGN